MQFVYPKGWSVQEGDGPHVINNFNFKNDFISILIDDSPTFFSKNESIDLLNNRAPNLLNIDNLQKKLNNRFIEIYRTDVSNDIVGNYPAKKFYTDGTVSMKGIQFRCVMITWFILYDDKQITFGGVFMVNSDMELKIKETIMEKIALTVRFPDQYTD